MLKRYLLKDMYIHKRYVIYTTTDDFGIGEYIMTFKECYLIMSKRTIK